MLIKLTIDNYALIDKSVIDFQRGFTVITGETGAGKSIMLDALSLLMGARADLKAMGNMEKKTVVEAVFSNPEEKIKKECEDNGIDWDSRELILRREITPSGKSRAFVNDTPVNLSILSKVSETLLDIHSQHGNSLINKSHEQLAIIDSFGRTEEFLNKYKSTFKKYVSLRNKLKSIKEALSRSEENREYLLFRLEQLDKLKPKRGELASLEREAEILGDADRIKSDLTQINTLIGDSNVSALKNLQSVASLIGSVDLRLFDAEGRDNISERLNTLKIELRDIADTIDGYIEEIDSNPEKLEKVQQRIETIYEVMKRFKVSDADALVDLHNELKTELENIEGDNTDVSSIERELKELAKVLKEDADSLTRAREDSSKKFSEILIQRIKPLGLPNMKFEVELQKGKFTQEGQDNVVFKCSFNKNHPLQPVSEIASGGEIARLMLGIKSVMSETINLPTLIFDEIDTGVSGEIAHKMGKLMKEMSKTIQVLAVTHLPQVASNGITHLKVYKEDVNNKTVSHIKILSDEERVNEIAGMLSGHTINKVALENARILLDSE